MQESQFHRPPRAARWGARGQDCRFEALDDTALPGLLGAGELGLIARDFARRVGAESTLLAVRDGTGLEVEVLAAWGVVSGRDDPPVPAADGFLGRVLSGGEAVLERFDADQDGSLGVAISGTRLTHAAGAALRSPGGPVGALCAGFTSAPPDPALTLWMVESYARLASLCLLDRGVLDGLLAGTQRDALTGCLNSEAILLEAGSNAEDMLAAADQALLAAKTLGGGAVVRASGPTAAPTAGRSAQQDAASHTSELRRVRFCGYCADRPNQEPNPRVCLKCGLGLVTSASAEIAPDNNDAFLIVDEHLLVGALSKRAHSLLGACENSAVDRHIDDFLTSADPHRPTSELFETALSRSARGETTVRDIDVHLRSTDGDTIPFRARIGRCGPPAATLIVLTDGNQS